MGSLADGAATRLESDIDSKGGGTALTIRTSPTATTSTDVPATAARIYQRRRITGPGLDDETATVKLLASVAPSRPTPGWLLTVSATEAWSVFQVDPGGDTSGVYLLRCRKASMRGMPAPAGGFGSSSGGFGE